MITQLGTSITGMNVLKYINNFLLLFSSCFNLCISFLSEKKYSRARDHFLHAGQPEDFGAMLAEFATSSGYQGEADLFLTQAVLQWAFLH